MENKSWNRRDLSKRIDTFKNNHLIGSEAKESRMNGGKVMETKLAA